jgi:hypothetical protein
MLMFTEDTVSSQVYLNILQNDSVPFILGYVVVMNAAWFQWGGMTPSYTQYFVGFFNNIEKQCSQTDFLILIAEFKTM